MHTIQKLIDSKSVKFLLFFTGIYLFSLPRPAYAYLDPGTGSYIFQILIAGVFGSIFFFKSGIKKIRELFKHKIPEKERNKDV